MSTVLETVGLSVCARSRGELRTLVESVSFSVAAGTTHGLVGESGSGKSMTAAAIAGLLPANVRAGGEVRLSGRELLALPDAAARAVRTGEIGFVFQHPKAALNPRLTVGAQLRESLPIAVRRDTAASVTRALSLLDEVGVPRAYERLAAFPHELSGGLAQRVVIAMALARDPRLLIADEPTTALDTTIQRQILDLLDNLREHRRFGVLLITHDMGIVAERTTDLTVLEHGRVVDQGRSGAVFADPTSVTTRDLIDGAQFGDLGDAPASARGDALFDVRGASRAFRTHGAQRSVIAAIDDVDLSVGEGRSLGIVGESGSGKTTLARTLLGLERVDAGSVAFHGTNLELLSPAQRRTWRQVVQYVGQDPRAALNPHLSIAASIAEPLRGAGMPRVARLSRVHEVMDEVALPRALADRRPGALSGGQLQRAAIARALALRPEVLIADEPVASLDVTVQARIISLLESLRDEFGLTYVLISHDLRIVKRLCQDVVVMKDGAIVERGETVEVFQNPNHPYTRRLLDAIPRLPAKTLIP